MNAHSDDVRRVSLGIFSGEASIGMVTGQSLVGTQVEGGLQIEGTLTEELRYVDRDSERDSVLGKHTISVVSLFRGHTPVFLKPFIIPLGLIDFVQACKKSWEN